MSTKPRVKLPDTIKTGDIIEIRTLVDHIMETGNRRDKDGAFIPRHIIHTFTATFAGKEVFRADLNSGISANPFLAFHLRVTGPGDLVLTWIDDSGVVITDKRPITPA
jgi:sulfur-oxidizing protein SoxZ